MAARRIKIMSEIEAKNIAAKVSNELEAVGSKWLAYAKRHGAGWALKIYTVDGDEMALGYFPIETPARAIRVAENMVDAHYKLGTEHGANSACHAMRRALGLEKET